MRLGLPRDFALFSFIFTLFLFFTIMSTNTDLSDKRQVAIDEGEKKARELNVMFIESSAKSGYNVKQLFRRVAAALPGMESPEQKNDKDLIEVKLKDSSATEPNENESGCMC